MVKQGYKQTEIGVIPEDWDYDFAGLYLDFLTGFPFKSDEFSNHGTKLLRGSNVKRNEIVWNEDLNRYWENIDHSLTKYFLKEGDIVISMDGSLVGRSFGQISNSDLPCLLVQRVARLRGVKIHTNYLKQYYCSDFFTSHCDNNKTSSAIPHISPKDILEFKIAFPKSLTEQEAIATALSDADAWIESLEQLIAKKRLIKQGAMQELLTLKEDWESKTLLEIADKKRDLFNDGDWIESEHIIDEGIRLVQTGNIGIGKFLNKGNRKYINEKSFNDLKCKELKEGDLLICRLAEPAGRACIFPKTKDSKNVTSVDVTVFRPDEHKYNRKFLMYIFCTNGWFNEIIEKVGGTTHKRISRSNLGNISIKIPSLPEQERIATILSDIDAELEALENQLAKARQIKQGMMQELLTGRVRLG